MLVLVLAFPLIFIGLVIRWTSVAPSLDELPQQPRFFVRWMRSRGVSRRWSRM
jgi:hypothetical protein